ncbi:MAG: hypothetical protein Tsb0015_15960 [Simkaniaceae bacterium]
MDPIKKADLLKKEADAILREKGIEAQLRKHAGVHYGGSYALDLMAWRDIDIYISFHPDPFSLEKLISLENDLIRMQDVIMAKIAKFMHKRRPEVPEGLFLGMRVFHGDWKNYWKLDVWALSPAQIEENQKYIEKIQENLTAEKRNVILRMKNLLLTSEGRTPVFSSYHVYQAVVFKNLTDEEEIIDYLLDQGVVLK